MPRVRLFAVSILACAAACGGGDGPPEGALVLEAYDEPSEDVYNMVPLDTSCLGTPSSDVPPASPIMLTTLVDDFQLGDAVPGAEISAFEGANYQGPYLATGTTTVDGDDDPYMPNLMITIPSGSYTRIGFKMHDPAGDYFDTFLLNQYFGAGGATTSPSTMSMVSLGTGTALPALVGITRTPGTGVLAGTLRDCQNHEVKNFTATVSSTSGTETPVAGARTFYFDPTTDLPARNTVWQASSQNGLFTVLELPPTTTAYVQMWGYLNQEDLDNNEKTLLSELQVPVIADNIVTGSYELLRQ